MSSACSPGGGSAGGDECSEQGIAASAEAIDRFKEIVIVDDAVITDDRAKNALDGVWSFRHAIENAAPEGMDGGDFVLAWLHDWVTVQDVNGYPCDRAGEQRDAEMNRLVICPWLHRTASNDCNTDCSTCDARKIDLALAPFHLIAIINRMELRGKPTKTGAAGEGRLVFGFNDGLGDDPNARHMPMSMTMEYDLPASLTVEQWAQKWHALGQFKAFDESYNAALQDVTTRFTERGVVQGALNGTALSQVRTNESMLDWIWQLREFDLDSRDGLLHLSTVKQTPAEALNGSDELKNFVLQNADKIRSDTATLPNYMLAGSADQFLYKWSLPGVDEPTRKAFAQHTCNGCHSAENPSIDSAFHISPFRSGIDKLSPFLNNPADPQHDDLHTRQVSLASALCGK